MKIAKRMAAMLLAVLLALPGVALAQIEGRSDHGAFALELDGKVYTALYVGNVYNLYSVPSGGGDFTLVDSGSELEDVVSANGFVYYLRTKDGVQNIMRIDPDGTAVVLSEFETGVQVSQLSWYDDVLYCIADSRLYIVDPDSGETQILCEELMDEYAIVSDVIFYISASDTKTYERTAPAQTNEDGSAAEPETLRQTSGTLWCMSALGTNPEKLVDEGVTSLRAYTNYLFFHNLADNYIMGTGTQMWLEGKLYRYNIETQQTASLNLDYDWDYFPTDAGLVVYTNQDISLYPLTGGDGTQLMTPEARTVLTASGSDAYVYEYTAGKLTRLPLDGSGAVTLVDDSDVLPSSSDLDDPLVVGNEDDDTGDEDSQAGDVSYDDEKGTTSPGSDSSYIFPNSSSKKLTRKQVLAIDKSLWGYARNEIWAKHGYEFKKGKYATYFSKKSWYKPGGFSTGDLNSIEWYNMELIKDLEQEYGLLDSSSSSSSNSSAKNNYYVLKEASSRKLTKKYLRNKLGSKSKYALARNEILARHGYVFKTAKYKKYFNNQKWYKPGGYSSSKLSNTEWYNIEQLKDLENE